jgi:hypothetical protein
LQAFDEFQKLEGTSTATGSAPIAPAEAASVLQNLAREEIDRLVQVYLKEMGGPSNVPKIGTVGFLNTFYAWFVARQRERL